jgi:hypothetical protein
MRELVVVVPTATGEQQDAATHFLAWLLQYTDGFRTREAQGFWRDAEGKTFVEECVEFVVAGEAELHARVVEEVCGLLGAAGEQAAYWVGGDGEAHVRALGEGAGEGGGEAA